jgi:GNAT superfamily N-acetyltransferase
MAVIVRAGNAGDMQLALPLLLERLKERAEFDPAYYGLKADAEKRFRHWLGPALEDPRHMLLVAEAGGAMVGCLAATVERDLPVFEIEEYAVVRMLWVEPGHRGRGIAGQLLERAAAEYAEMGVRQIRATVAAGRDVEHRVAGKAGFRAAAVTYLRDLTPPVPTPDSH